ncbi:MAG: DUF2200 domain-containing protein [Clostridiales bacterium]|nr:DUF2200 domain-containing protein [Clostridiales bacterium]
MSNDKVFSMPFAKVFPLLIAKAERKGRTREEVYLVTTWLTGYTAEQLDALLESNADYASFLKGMPCPNENRRKINGSVCGVKLGEIDDPLMLELRYLDKLVDELAKGKPMEKILRK